MTTTAQIGGVAQWTERVYDVFRLKGGYRPLGCINTPYKIEHGGKLGRGQGDLVVGASGGGGERRLASVGGETTPLPYKKEEGGCASTCNQCLVVRMDYSRWGSSSLLPFLLPFPQVATTADNQAVLAGLSTYRREAIERSIIVSILTQVG